MRKQIPTHAYIYILAIGITGCVAPTLTERLTRVEQHLDAVEASLDRLADQVYELKSLYGTDLPLPYRSKVELQAHIRRLEQQRAALLVNITPLHPTIRDIDRQIRMLKWQVGTVEQTTTDVSGNGEQSQEAEPEKTR